MKFLLLFVFSLLLTGQVYATTYYVSSATGDDTRSELEAQDIAKPWKTIGKVNAIMATLNAGDQVLFKRGEVFFGTLLVTISGASGSAIVFGAYGDGSMPELTGFVQLSAWQAAGNGIWEAQVAGNPAMVNTVTVNGLAKAIGRWPNSTATEQGYLHYQSYNANTSITDTKLTTSWTGGQVVMRKTRWILDQAEITSQSGTTINYNSPTGYGAAQGYGYFVQNHPGTLDQPGEWYYRLSKLGIYTGGASPQDINWQIRAGTAAAVIKINGRHDLTFENLLISGATEATVQVIASQNIQLSNCHLLFSGKDALDADGTTGLTVENNTVAYTNNNALNLSNCTNTILTNNQIRNTGMFAGMGSSGDGTYEALTISGDNNLITGNTIDSTGYVPLNFSGNNVTIKNNVISNFTLTKDDGGGIYTWNNGTNAPTNNNRLVTGNIVLGGKGAGAGTDHPELLFAHGIYIDDGAGQVELSGNTVANCGSNGIYIHNAHDIAIKQNTVYNNAIQLLMEHDNVAADKPIYNCTVTGNVLFAKLASQLSAAYKTKDNDIVNFGTFNQNYYARPIDDDLTIGVLQQVNGNYSYDNLSLESWKGMYNKDGSSGTSPAVISSYTIIGTPGTNQFVNGMFDSNSGGLYAYASAGNCVTSWDSGGHLDGGALNITFSSNTNNNNNHGSVIIGVGGLVGGKRYRLKFSMIGGNSNKAITTYLRQSTGGYADLSTRAGISITGNRQEKELLFTATTTESNASIVFDVPEQPSALFLDNIKLEQVEAVSVDPEQYLSFFYNGEGSNKTYAIGSPGIDVYKNNYQNTLSLTPFSSTIIIGTTPVDCRIILSKPVIVVASQ